MNYKIYIYKLIALNSFVDEQIAYDDLIMNCKAGISLINYYLEPQGLLRFGYVHYGLHHQHSFWCVYRIHLC